MSGARPEELRGQPGFIIATVPGQRDLHVVPEAPPATGAGERIAIEWVRAIETAVADAHHRATAVPPSSTAGGVGGSGQLGLSAFGHGTVPLRTNPMAMDAVTSASGSPGRGSRGVGHGQGAGHRSAVHPTASRSAELRAADAARLGRTLAQCADSVGRAVSPEQVLDACEELQRALRRDAHRTG